MKFENNDFLLLTLPLATTSDYSSSFLLPESKDNAQKIKLLEKGVRYKNDRYKLDMGYAERYGRSTRSILERA